MWFFMTTEEIWRFRCYFCMSQEWNVSTRRPELILCCKLQVACCRAPCSSINRIIFWCLSVTWLSPFLTPAKLKLLCFFLTAARQWWAQHLTRLNLNKHRDVGSVASLFSYWDCWTSQWQRYAEWKWLGSALANLSERVPLDALVLHYMKSL